MKKFFLIASMLLSFVALNAQIGEVKKAGKSAKIFNNQGKYTGFYINLCSNCIIAGYNAKYIVINEGDMAKIYDEKGNYTGKYVSLCSSCYVKNVSDTAILVKDNKDGILSTKYFYYDFEGNYIGN